MRPPIDRSSLGQLIEIKSGGFGTVYQLPDFRLDGYGPLAYKEFSDPGLETIANLREIIDFHEGLTPRQRAVVDASAAWPLRLVVRGRTVLGFVMPLADADFFFSQRLPSGKDSREPASAQWLIVDADKALKANANAPTPDDLPRRLVLVAKLVHVIGVLHRGGLVYGDLSENNVLFTVSSPPRILLIDCDAATARPADIGQANTPGWTPPELVGGARVQSLATDRYKLALFVLRCLNPGNFVSQSVDPQRLTGILDREGMGLLRAGLGKDPDGRPDARTWYAYLTALLVDLTRPPTTVGIAASETLVRAGDVVTVKWQARGASRAVLRTPSGVDSEVDPSAGELPLPVVETGAFALTLENGYGSTVAATDPVYVFAPPRIESVVIPEPAVPALEVGSQVAFNSALDRITDLRPSLPSMQLPDFISTVAVPRLTIPDVSVLVPLDLGVDGVASAFGDLMGSLSAHAGAVADRYLTASGAATEPGPTIGTPAQSLPGQRRSPEDHS